MSTDKKLAHFVLQTGDLPALRDWYLKVLDAHVVYENEFLSLMTFDEEHHRLGIVRLPQSVQRTPTTVGLAHTAYTFTSLISLLAKYEDLKKSDIHPHVPVQHGPTTSIYYRDPDGNTVELQIDNFTTPEEATSYLHSEEFHADPFGPSFDPDTMPTARRPRTAAVMTRNRLSSTGTDQTVVDDGVGRPAGPVTCRSPGVASVTCSKVCSKSILRRARMSCAPRSRPSSS